MTTSGLPGCAGWLARWAAPGPRPWREALWRGLVAVYAPQPIAFLTSPLGECDHCVGQFWTLFPAIPGLFAGVLVNQGGRSAGLWVTAGLVVLGLLTAAVRAARRGGRFGAVTALGIALLTAANATLVGHMLRM